MIADTTRRIGAVTFQVADLERAVAMVVGAIKRRSQETFAFCNMHTFNLTRCVPEFATALSQAIVFNDGVGIDIAGLLLHGKSFPANLNGTDLTPAILVALDRPTAVYLIGSPPGIAERAACALASRFPNIRVVGTHHGFFDESESVTIVNRVRAARTDLLLLGMGNPRQEIWAARHSDRIGATIICVGAFLDFSAGAVPRAPRWVRALRCEWVYRLALEPRRMTRRYLGGAGPFLWAVIRERLENGRSQPG